MSYQIGSFAFFKISKDASAPSIVQVGHLLIQRTILIFHLIKRHGAHDGKTFHDYGCVGSCFVYVNLSSKLVFFFNGILNFYISFYDILLVFI